MLAFDGRVWELPEERKCELFHQFGAGEEPSTLDLAEADWSMIDEVVDHWEHKLSRLQRAKPSAHGGAKNHRKHRG